MYASTRQTGARKAGHSMGGGPWAGARRPPAGIVLLLLLLALVLTLTAVATGQASGGGGGDDDGLGRTPSAAAAAPWAEQQHRALLSPFSPDARPPLNYTKAFTACK